MGQLPFHFCLLLIVLAYVDLNQGNCYPRSDFVLFFRKKGQKYLFIIVSKLLMMAGFFLAVITSFDQLGGRPYNVTYNKRSLLFNGEQVLLTSGDIHYTRTTPQMWPTLFAKAKYNFVNG